jgi:hypothetical protein
MLQSMLVSAFAENYISAIFCEIVISEVFFWGWLNCVWPYIGSVEELCVETAAANANCRILLVKF